jgi:fibronectin type 3 domain-containing protein
MRGTVDHRRTRQFSNRVMVLAITALFAQTGGRVNGLQAQERSGTPWPATLGAQYTVMIDGGSAFVQPGTREIPTGDALLFQRQTPDGAWIPSDRAPTPPANASHRFSYVVAVSGDYAVVGAEWRNAFRGEAYALRRAEGTWAVAKRLSPSDPGRCDHFGQSVAASGVTMVVGAPWHDLFRGAVYVFERVDDAWEEQRKLTRADEGPARELADLVVLSRDLIAVRIAGNGTPPEDVTTARTAVELASMIDAIGDPPPLLPSTSPPAPASVQATDGTLEDRVEITWSTVGMDAIVYKVLRNGQLLSVVSSDETSWSDETAQLGVTYQYCVLVKDMAGLESETPTCDEGSRIIFPPVAVVASDGEYKDGVRITWTDVSAINTGYSILRDGEPLGAAAANATSYDDVMSFSEVVYSYDVVATAEGGYQSTPGSDTGWRGVILPPRTVTASDGQYLDQVRITWEGQDLVTEGYRIYRDDVLIDSTAAEVTSYDDTGVILGNVYTYCVSATGVEVTGVPEGVFPSSGEVRKESIRICDTGSIGLIAPANVSASDSTYDDRIRITWEDRSKYEDGYEIARAAFGDTVVLDTTGANVTSFDDFTAGPDTTYLYFMRAVSDLGGVSADSSDTGYRSVVLAPTNVTASDGTFEDRVEIAWESASTTAVLFKIYRDGTMIKSVSRGERGYRDYLGTAGQVYEYKVGAVTALEDEAEGPPDQGRRELLAPSGVTAGDEAYENKVIVTWTDNSRVEDGYTVSRHDTAAVEPDTSFVIGPNRTSLTDYCGKPGVTYLYSVAAFDSAGGSVGFSPAGADNGRRVLLAPSGVGADKGVSETAVEVTWRDNSDSEDGYHVYRDSLLIVATEDNTTTFTDHPPDLGIAHIYHVSAFDQYGESEGDEDTGYTSILAPGSVNVSDDYSDGIDITWIDRSEVEEGYRVYRGNELIATMAQNTTHYRDAYYPPGIVGSYETQDANRACLSGDYAYVAVGNYGLEVVDVSDPANPALVGSCTTPGGFEEDVAVSGDLALIADNWAGLQVIDITDPANPSVVGSYESGGGYAHGVAAVGDLAFIAYDYNGLVIVDISDPTNPSFVGSYDVGGGYGAMLVTVAGDLALVGYDEGVQIVDISNPASPSLVGSYDTSDNPSGIEVAGDLAFVADNTSGLQILDISNPANPSLVGSYDTPGYTRAVAVAGDLAFVADLLSGLQVLDISNPAHPVGAGSIPIPGAAEDVCVSGAYAYVSASGAGLLVIRPIVAPGELDSGIPYRYCVRTYGGLTESEAACDWGSIPESDAASVTTRLQKLLAEDGTGGEQLGSSVSISADLAVIGAPGDDDKGTLSGSAYIYRRGGDGSWTQEQKLLAADGIDGDSFGLAVAISGDLALVGAPRDDDHGDQSGSAYVFRRGGDGSWTQEKKLLADDGAVSDWFGSAVAISGDLALVGAPDDDDQGDLSGSAYVFRRGGDGSWTQEQKLLAADGADSTGFGHAVAISGDLAVVGAFKNDPNAASGSAYLFHRGGDGSWTQEQKLLADDGTVSDWFGFAVAISGDLAVVGAAHDLERGIFAGAAYVFRRGGDGSWTQEQKLLAADGVAFDFFGIAVSVSGNLAIVGAYADRDKGPLSGSAYIFRRGGDGNWTQEQKLLAPDGADSDYFGNAVSISGDLAVIGAYGDDESGSAYIRDLKTAVAASDGTYGGRISVTWVDDFTNEGGFIVYRDGAFRTQLPAGAEAYDDVGDPLPGQAYEYRVTALVDSSEIDLGSDLGWRPTDGEIRGRVATREGAGVSGIRMDLTPPSSRALLFDGMHGSGRVADGSAMNFSASQSFTVEAWVKYTAGGGTMGTHGTILAKTGPSTRYPFLLRTDRGNGAPGRLVFSMSDGASPVEVVSTRDDLNDGEWTHVACVHDATLKTLQLYIDGVLDAETSYTALRDVTNDDDLYLGVSSFGSYGGEIDEVRIWNVARDSLAIGEWMSTPLNGGEANLVGYWPLDEEGDKAAVGRVAASPYCVLEFGAYRTDDVAPLDVGAITDVDGNFSITGIPYGDYQVRPSSGTRQFQPPATRVALNSGSPVQNLVNFTDISSFTVSGAIRYAGTECPAVDIPLSVDGRAAGATDAKGKFAVSLGLGEHWIRPDLEGHRFGPDSLFVDARSDTIVNDVTGAAFTDSTTFRLRGHLGGGCGRVVGAMAITIRSENDCLQRTLTYSSGDTAYSVSLPPQSYLVSASVDPQSIPEGLSKTDVVRYFQNLAVRLAEMDSADVVMDFVYRAPLRVSIRGFEDYVESCPGPLTFGQRVLPDGLPVIPQLKVLPLTIEVNEDYGSGGLCPLDSGTVVVYDEVFDRQNTPFELTVLNGTAACTTFSSTPSFTVGRTDGEGNDRSFQKAISAVVTAEGRPSVTGTEWVLVTGHVAPEGADFVTATTTMPLYVLRDPPGDNSSAFLETGHSLRTRVEWDKNVELAEAGIKVEVGYGIRAKWFVGLGAGTISGAGMKKTFDFEELAGIEHFTESGTDITFRTAQRFATSPDAAFIGREGDVFVGAGYNFIFSEVDRIEVEGCEITRSTMVGYQPESLQTAYAYSEMYIEDVLIPELQSKIDALDELPEIEEEEEARRDSLQVGLEYWQEILAENDSLKAEAETVKNRSYSAGASFTYFESSDTTETYTRKDMLVVDYKGGAGGFKFHTDYQEYVISILSKFHHEGLASSEDTSGTNTHSVGYTLNDDDIGDHFTVDIKNDGRYPSPVFDVRGGVSSCPYEAWPDPEAGGARMVPRDKPVLFVDPVHRDGIPPDDPATFTITLANQSPTGEDRLYVLRLLNKSNPYGAVVSVGGVPVANGISYEIDPAQSQTATLTVERGPTKYRYEDLALVFYPPCEVTDMPYPRPSGSREQSGALADTAYLSVVFQAPCSDVSLVLPDPGWRFTKADQDTGGAVLLLLSDYELQVSEDDSVQGVWGQYRRLGGEDGPSEWVSIAAESLGTSETLIRWCPPEELADGVYELRAYTQCSGGRGYSDVSTGTIERHGPQVMGTPEPSDGELSFGEDISVTFSEAIDCRTVLPDSVTLTYLDGPLADSTIAVEAICGGKTIIIVPAASSSELEGRRLEARVAGVRDMAGNPMVKPVTWAFDYRTSRFTWSRLHVTADVPYRDPGGIAAELVNGTGEPVDFTVTDVPVWIDSVSAWNGTIPASGKATVVFSLPNDLALGIYEGEVKAAAEDTTQGVAVFDLAVTVSCHDPAWEVDPSAFEHSMTVVAALDIGGTISTDPNDRVAAFVGDQLRGTASLQEVPVGMPPYPYLAFLTVYSNRAQGETVRFQVWDGDECRLYPATVESHPFVANSAIGSTGAPVTLTASEEPGSGSLAIAVNRGWSWISTNRTSPDMSVNAVLSDLTPTAGDLIKSQVAFSQFVAETTGWSGSLENLDGRSAYMIRLTDPGTIVHTGSPADMRVPVQQGWNWIGYLPQGPIAVTDALADLATRGLVTVGDVVKGQSGFAEYTGGGWFGSLLVMEPGKGYKLHLAGAVVDSFAYPEYVPEASPSAVLASAVASAPVSSEPERESGADVSGWSVNPCAFEHNMTVTAVLEIHGSETTDERDVIGAFVGDDCRGVARPVYVGGVGRHEVFLMVCSNEAAGETVELRAFDADAGVVYDVAQTLAFEADKVEGRVQEPIVLDARSVRGGGEVPRIFALAQNFPNPFSLTTGITYQVPSDDLRITIRIYDVSGRLVRTLVDATAMRGKKTVIWDGSSDRGLRVGTGIYFYRMTAPNFEATRRMIVIR